MSESSGPVTVSAVIPVFNNEDSIGPLLDSLLAQTVAPDEILVVDDESTDSTAAIADAYEGVRVVRLEINSGPSVARNEGVEAATSDVIFFLDSDVVVDDKAVELIKKAFEARPDIVALNGVMKREPLNPGLCSRYKAMVEYSWGQAIPLWDTSSKCINARIGAIRKDAFQAAGGFDPVYRKPSVEDHEFGLRFTHKHVFHTNHELQAAHHFPNLWGVCRNYYDRASAHLELMWSVPHHGATDKGGVSTSNALQFIYGAMIPVTLPAAAWGHWWLPTLMLILFVISSWTTLKVHFRHGGPLFYLNSLWIHFVLGCVTVIAGAKTFLTFRILGIKSQPVPAVCKQG